MPIEDVREIVSVSQPDIITVRGKHTIDVRDEFIPLVSIDDIFQWREIDYGYDNYDRPGDTADKPIDVVILQTAGRSMGVRVEELLGSQDMVVKSLSDNFIDIRGLSGASILGDGSVCLMLDVGTVFQLASSLATRAETKEIA